MNYNCFNGHAVEVLQGLERCRCACLPFVPKAWYMRLADSPLAAPREYKLRNLS